MSGLDLVIDLLAHLALTALPMAAAMLSAARLGIRQVPVLLCIGLAGSGVVALLAFWAFYLDPVVGESFAYFVTFGSIVLVGWILHGRTIPQELLRALSVPLMLWALGSTFLIFLGFAHGGIASPLATSSTRFSGQLPADNDIPRYFADWFFQYGHRGTPPEFPGEWLSSDRPPLQIGYILYQRPYGWDESGLHYQVLGVVLQQLWIIGLWALLLAARIGRVTRMLTMVAVLISDIAIVNGFFVWPKLLPTAMLLAAAVIVTPLWPALRRSLAGAALVATLLALALLGHGASVFGVIPLLAIAAYRGLPDWRWIGVALLVGLALVGPWSAYQHFGDPPGNRLSKWMIGGAVEVDDRGVVDSVVDSYREAGFDGVLSNKADNFNAIVGGGAAIDNLGNTVEAFADGQLESAVRSLRSIFFYNLLPSLGMLLIAPFAMILGRWQGVRRSADWDFALVAFAILLIGAIGWGVLLFGGSVAGAVIHQGSYLLPIVGFCGCVAGLRAVFPRFAVYFVATAGLLMLALYVPSFDPPPGSVYSPIGLSVAFVALVAFSAVGLRAGRGSDALNTLAR